MVQCVTHICIVFLDLGFKVYGEGLLKFLKEGVHVIQPFVINPFPTSPMVHTVCIHL